jgi:hypothetical protein
MNDGTPHDDHGCAAHEVRYLPDAPLGDDTEFVFIDRIAFVNAHKHEEVVAHHVAENERLQEALRVIRGPEDRGPWIEIYRAAGGGYEGLQAIAEAALDG